MARAVAEDDRFKAFVTVASWFQHPATTPVFYGGAEGVSRRLDLAAAAMNKFRKNGQMIMFQRTTQKTRIMEKPICSSVLVGVVAA